jgi:hypothetical protein
MFVVIQILVQLLVEVRRRRAIRGPNQGFQESDPLLPKYVLLFVDGVVFGVKLAIGDDVGLTFPASVFALAKFAIEVVDARLHGRVEPVDVGQAARPVLCHRMSPHLGLVRKQEIVPVHLLLRISASIGQS